MTNREKTTTLGLSIILLIFTFAVNSSASVCCIFVYHLGIKQIIPSVVKITKKQKIVKSEFLKTISYINSILMIFSLNTLYLTTFVLEYPVLSIILLLGLILGTFIPLLFLKFA